MDFGSRNGVALNGRRIFEPMPLRDLDRIEIAGHSLIFHERKETPIPKGSSAGGTAWKTTECITENFAATNHAAILLDRGAKITTITPQAREWLKAYFYPAAGAGVLPEKLDAWVKQELAGHRSKSRGPVPHEALVIPKEGKRLVIQLAERHQQQHLLLLTEEQPVFSMELLQSLGLTPRESEVLHWLAEGKTNPEIGIILEASPRTVGKHVEHIYAKLGVESRTAALLYVVEKLSHNTMSRMGAEG